MSKTEKSCGAVVFRRTKDSIKYLLLHYEAGHWDFPKGNSEQGEEEKQTAEREIKEETGIKDSKFIDNFKQEINYFYKIGQDAIHKWVVFYLAETKTEEVEISSEHIGYIWVNCEHALKRLTYENSKNVLKKANDFLTNKLE